MPARSPKAGSRYLTLTGAPVQVLEARDEVVVLQSLASDNRLLVPIDYPLRPFNPKQAVWELRPSPYSPRCKMAETPASPAAAKPLAPIIDALLLAGDKTMTGIVREVRRKASAAWAGYIGLRKKTVRSVRNPGVTVPYESSGQSFKPWRPRFHLWG